MKVMYQNGNHWVARLKDGSHAVYRNEVTASVRCAIIGYKGDEGLMKAIEECNRMERTE